MWKYVVRRVFGAVLVLWLVSLIVFTTIRALPGDALLVKLGEAGQLSEEDAAAARAELGLDDSLPVAYVKWATSFVLLDPGNSLIYEDTSVATRIKDALPPTLELGIFATLIGLPFALGLGAIAALRQDTWLDYPVRLVAVAGISIPSFVLATAILMFTARQWSYAPPFGWVNFWEDPLKNLEQVYIPVAILGFGFSATTMRMTRSAVLEVMRQDYVRTARAKGLAARDVFSRHIMRNALISVATLVGLQVVFLFSGSLILEIIFAIPGVGRLTITAIRERDYPQVMANTMFFATIMVTMNLIVDLFYGVLDPRVKYT
jgi:peptide/nickel transport system permease protein